MFRSSLIILFFLVLLFFFISNPYQALYYVLGLSILLIEVIRKKQNWDFLTVINIIYVLLYSMVPILLYSYPEKLNYYVDVNGNDMIKATLYIYICYIFIFIGYYYAKRTKGNLNPIHIDNKSIFYLSIIFFSIGIVTFLLYADSYGGVSVVIENADRIRSGWFTTSSPFVFFKLPSAMLTIAFWCMTSLVFITKKNINTKKYLSIIMLFFFIFALVRALATAGRSEIIYLILPVIVGWYRWKEKRPNILLLSILSIFLVFFIVNGDSIIGEFIGSKKEYTPVNNNTNVFWDFIREFAHPFVSLTVMIENIPYTFEPGYFKDVILSIVQIAPERLLGINLPFGVSAYNTYLLTGIFKETVPPGLVGFFFYSFLHGGVVIGGFIFGFVCSKLDSLLIKMKRIHPIFSIMYVAFAISILGFMMGGDPKVYINLYLWGLLVGFLSLLFITKK